ncbi:dihydroorotase [Phycisphaerales bacterium ac7]
MPTEANLFLRGAQVIDPASDVSGPAHVRIANGQIAAVGPDLVPEPGDTEIDVKGRVLSPAFADVHVHLREPGGESSETVATGCRSAAAGGFARVWCMPNTKPVNDSVLTTRYLQDRASEHARSGDPGAGVRVHPVACLTRGMQSERLADFSALWAAGAGAFSDDGLPVANAGMMRRAMQAIVDLPPNQWGGRPVVFDHCEDLSITGPGVMHEGRVSADLGLPGIPRSSEAVGIARDCALSLETGCRLHVCHVSTIDSVEVIRYFKVRGAPVTAEVSPHHLLFTDERVRRADNPGLGDTHAKMKPPLCDERDRQALIVALEDGTIDCIATDHAPHDAESKSRSFEDAPFGIIGMETAFCSLHTEFVVGGKWSLEFLIDKLTRAPRDVVGWQCFGSLQVGMPGDVVVIDPVEEWEFGPEHIGSKSRNCPWFGVRMVGRVVATYIEGRVAFDVTRGANAPVVAGP